MDLKSILKCDSLRVIFVSILFHLFFNTAYAAEFEIEEIITAIKQDIHTARLTGEGSPNFEVESVKVVLTVVSTVTHNGVLVMKVAGFDYDSQNQKSEQGSYHKLTFTLTPSGTPGFSPDSSFGLVEPINKIKSAMRKAYNNPPSSKLDAFTVKLKFAIEKGSDGGFKFNIIDLKYLIGRNIATHSVTIKMKLEAQKKLETKNNPVNDQEA